MGYRAFLISGNKELELSADPYSIPASFRPPAGVVEWSLPVDIHAFTQDATEAAFKDLELFLEEKGDERNPLFFEWRPANFVPFRPICGQRNAGKRTEILGSTLVPSTRYAITRNNYLPDNELKLITDGRWQGIPQPMWNATGAVFEWYIGRKNGASRGVCLQPAGTNLVDNPIFAHSTYTTGWTIGDIYEQNSDEKYVLFGKYSLRITRSSTAIDATVSITTSAATHTLTAYIVKQDFSAVTSSDATLIWNGAEVTPSKYLDLGGGFYRLEYTASLTAAAHTLGVRVAATNSSIYICGVQVEAKAHPTALMYGDMIGHSWAGTEHNSDSSRSAGWLWTEQPKRFYNYPEGTICIALLPLYDSSAVSTTQQLLYPEPGAFPWQLVWDGANSRWSFSDGANTINSAATSFSAMVPVVIHITWSRSGGLRLYVNGTSAASGTFRAASFDDAPYLRLFHMDGVIIQGYTAYDRALSSTEVGADYTDMTPKVVTAKGKMDSVIWDWTAAGTSFTDNYIAVGHSNYRIIGGVPGTQPAEVLFCIQTSGGDIDTNALGGIFLSRITSEINYPIPMTKFYGELSGTVDATASGGQYRTEASLTTTSVTLPASLPLHQSHIDILAGQEIALLFRTYDVLGTGLYARMGYYFGTDAAFYSAWKPIESAAKWLMRLTKSIGFKDIRRSIRDIKPGIPSGSGFYLEVKRSAGTGDLRVDFYQIVARPWIRIWSNSATSNAYLVIYDSKTGKVLALDINFVIATDLVYKEGQDIVNLLPGMYNYITCIGGDIRREAQATSLIGDGMQFNTVNPRHQTSITPYWATL